MENLPRLAEKIDLMGWSPGPECVFFNFAWRGFSKLTDGGFSDQISNAVHAAEAVRIAKNLGCIKFVNAGTLEETIIERFLDGDNNNRSQSTQPDYALAKLASRDMCTMVAYLKKIDYVHTRMSVPLSSNLSRGTYVAATLKKIAEGMPYEAPSNKQLFDIVFLDDVVRAYYLIGNIGKNKANYFIGTSKPATLAQYFARFERIVKNQCSVDADLVAATETDFFSTVAIHQDTGFVASTRLEDIIEKVRNQ
jgi:nucleoside-diphosphate-sugar epimerase